MGTRYCGGPETGGSPGGLHTLAAVGRVSGWTL